jgi:UDP-glucose 4-epimerase
MTNDRRLPTILITGGCGFLGTNLVNYLSGKGYKVRILDNLSAPSRKSFCQESAVNSLLSPQTVDSGLSTIDLVVGDIRDYEAVKKAAEGVGAVVHLAAHTSVVESLEKPREAWDINVNGTLNLLEACRLNKVDRFIFASSNAVVGEQEPPIDETKIPRPLSPYGASKLAGEALCSTYYHSFGLKTISLRFSNLYGPHSEHKPSVIARYIDWARKGEPLIIYGDGNQTRDFVHVDDVCQAIHLSLTNSTNSTNPYQSPSVSIYLNESPPISTNSPLGRSLPDSQRCRDQYQSTCRANSVDGRRSAVSRTQAQAKGRDREELFQHS